MKYLLFAGRDYYPNGGIDDYVGSFDSINGAKVYWQAHHESKSHSADGQWGQIGIAENGLRCLLETYKGGWREPE